MARKANVPQVLRRAPFTLTEARSAGVTPSALKGKAWRRLGAELYCWSECQPDKWTLLTAWKRLLPGVAVFCGRTAAAIHGLDFDPANPVEVTVSRDSSLRSIFGLQVRHCEPRDQELTIVRGLRVTSLERTLRDLAVQWPAGEALVALDMAIHLRLATVIALGRYTQSSAGRPGAGRLREILGLAEPAESPMETRLRWLFHSAGLPRPQVQVNLHDQKGVFVGRADLYYPQARLVIEFDGGIHRNGLVADDRRQNNLIGAGFTVLRFTSADLRGRPEVVVAQVRAALIGDSARFAQDRRNSGPGSARLVQNVPYGDAA